MARLETNNIFTKFLAGTNSMSLDKSRQWIRSKAKNLTTSQNEILNLENERKKNIPYPGKMYFFRYDPKTKEKLPFYDTFPLIFCVKFFPDGFFGLNFHYLAPKARANLMDALYSVISDKRMDENTRIMISYNILKSSSRFREFAPCFKHYLYSQLRSNLVEIYSNEWEVALFLPIAKFEKSSKNAVYQSSYKIIRNL